MTNRREFLRTGVTVSSLPLALNVLLPASARTRDVSVRKAVFDDRYFEGRVFGAAAQRLDVPARALDNGDITSFWYEELDPMWRKAPAAIAGTTQFGPLFVVSQLAKERGMRIAIQIEHEANSDGTLTHRITASRDTLALAEHLQSQGVDWPVLVAVLAAHGPSDSAVSVTRTLTTPGARPVVANPVEPNAPETVIHYYTSAAIRDGEGVPWDGPLFSWLIAPNSRT